MRHHFSHKGSPQLEQRTKSRCQNTIYQITNETGFTKCSDIYTDTQKAGMFRSFLTFFRLSKWEPASTAFDKEQDDIDRAHINQQFLVLYQLRSAYIGGKKKKKSVGHTDTSCHFVRLVPKQTNLFVCLFL